MSTSLSKMHIEIMSKDMTKGEKDQVGQDVDLGSPMTRQLILQHRDFFGRNNRREKGGVGTFATGAPIVANEKLCHLINNKIL